MSSNYSPKYVQLADLWREKIISGEFKVGEKLLPDSVLAEHYGVNKRTVANGMEILMNEGLVSRTPKRGTIVLKDCVEKKTSNAVAVFLSDSGRLGKTIFSNLIHRNLYPVAINNELFQQAVYSPDYTAWVQRIMENVLNDNPYGLIVEGERFMPYEFLKRNIKRVGNMVFVRFNLTEQVIPGAQYVFCDPKDSGIIAAKELIRKGHRKLTFIGHAEPLAYPQYAMSPQFRIMEGMRETCSEYGIEFDEKLPQRIIAGDNDIDAVYETLKAPDAPTGCMLSFDSRYTQCLLPALQILGMKCPDDLAVIGCYNSDDICRKYDLSSVSHKPLAMARKAVAMLRNETDETYIKIKPEFIERSTS